MKSRQKLKKKFPRGQTIYETKLNQTKPREIYNLKLRIVSDVFMSTLQTVAEVKSI